MHVHRGIIIALLIVVYLDYYEYIDTGSKLSEQVQVDNENRYLPK